MHPRMLLVFWAMILALSYVCSASKSMTWFGVMVRIVALKSSIPVWAIVAKKSGDGRPECWLRRGAMVRTTVIAVVMKQKRDARAMASKITKNVGAQVGMAVHRACASM